MAASVASALRITIVTPAPRGSRAGNRVTALRWAGLLRQLGHRVRLASGWHGQDADVLVAVHAIKTATAVLAAAADRPQLRVVTLLAGTDVYPHFAPDATALAAVRRADALIALQPLTLDALPEALRHKARTIVQSATAVPAPRAQRFTVAQLGNLRPVKQQLVALAALTHVPPTTAIDLVIAGGALDPAYATAVERALERTPRARWLGEISRRDSKRLLASSHACLVPSRSEGGANVVSEAIAAGTPVLCSHVPGNLGLLGEDWPATFPPGDAQALARLLVAAAADDGALLEGLRRRITALQPMVAIAREREAWRRLLAEIAPGR